MSIEELLKLEIFKTIQFTPKKVNQISSILKQKTGETFESIYRDLKNDEQIGFEKLIYDQIQKQHEYKIFMK